MADIWIDVDAAVTVPVNIAPLIDDTDFKSREVALTYDQAGMDLVWNFITCAGVITQTAVTPTTAGNYDWAHVGDGMYKIEIPASGGVSINNDTEGFGWFTGFCTGVLPWRGPTIGFRRAALNDLFIDGGTASTNLEDFFDGTGYAGGTARLKTDVDTIKTQAITCAAGVTVLASVGTAATSTAQTGDCFPLVSTEVAEIYAAVITNAAGVDIAADIIAMKADTAAILLDTAEIGAAGAGLTALAQASAYTAARAGYIDKLNIAGTVLHTSLTMADADSLTADGIMDHVRKISWVIFSKLSVTDATGAWTLTKDDGTTSAATGTITDNAVTTIRSTPTWA